MRVEIQLKETSQSLVWEGAKNTYQKGDFYCVTDKVTVWKFPIQSVSRIIETYREDDDA